MSKSGEILKRLDKAVSYFPYQWNGLRWSLGAITAVFLTWEIGSNIDQITPFINNQLNPSPVATNYTQVSPDYQPVPRPGYVTGNRQNGMSGAQRVVHDYTETLSTPLPTPTAREAIRAATKTPTPPKPSPTVKSLFVFPTPGHATVISINSGN